MLDISGDPAAVSMYRLLRDRWWPHPAHGEISIQQTPGMLAFGCSCGETLGIPLSVAFDLGLIDADSIG